MGFYFDYIYFVFFLKKRFASWVHDLSAIDLSLNENSSKTTIDNNTNFQLFQIDNFNIDLTDYIDNSGWILKNVSLIRREK